MSSAGGYCGPRDPRSSTTGSASASGVPAQPPSENDRGPPSASRPPPRMSTKSSSIRCCSGVNADASTLPRMIAAVLEQLLARRRESVLQLLGAVDAEPQVLVRRVDRGLGRALQQHDLQVVVLVGRLADELRLGPRLALEIQNLLAAVVRPRSARRAGCSARLPRWAAAGSRNWNMRGPDVGRLEPHLHRLRLAVAGQRRCPASSRCGRRLRRSAAPSCRRSPSA